MVNTIPAGTAGWDVPLNAALIDLQNQINTRLALSGGTLTGALTGVSFTTDSAVRSAFFKTTSTTQHAATIFQAATSGVDVAAALNVVSWNPESSSMYLSGRELNRGTLKVAHENGGANATADAGAAAISVDLKWFGKGGTAAQGLFITATEGPTTGNLIVARNNGRDDFVIKGSGRVGIGMDIGEVPEGLLEVKQVDTTTPGLVVNGLTGGAALLQVKNPSGTVSLEVSNTGSVVHRGVSFFTNHLQLGSTSTDVGGAVGAAIGMKNVTTAPSANPTGGVILYAVGGRLKVRLADGTDQFVALTAT